MDIIDYYLKNNKLPNIEDVGQYNWFESKLNNKECNLGYLLFNNVKLSTEYLDAIFESKSEFNDDEKKLLSLFYINHYVNDDFSFNVHKLCVTNIKLMDKKLISQYKDILLNVIFAKNISFDEAKDNKINYYLLSGLLNNKDFIKINELNDDHIDHEYYNTSLSKIILSTIIYPLYSVNCINPDQNIISFSKLNFNESNLFFDFLKKQNFRDIDHNKGDQPNIISSLIDRINYSNTDILYDIFDVLNDENKKTYLSIFEKIYLTNLSSYALAPRNNSGLITPLDYYLNLDKSNKISSYKEKVYLQDLNINESNENINIKNHQKKTIKI